MKYGNPLPIWVVVEFLDFGAAVRLLGLMKKTDQNEIASSFGIRGGKLLHAMVRNLSNVRNMAAHHRRLWNRSLT